LHCSHCIHILKAYDESYSKITRGHKYKYKYIDIDKDKDKDKDTDIMPEFQALKHPAFAIFLKA